MLTGTLVFPLDFVFQSAAETPFCSVIFFYGSRINLNLPPGTAGVRACFCGTSEFSVIMWYCILQFIIPLFLFIL